MQNVSIASIAVGFRTRFDVGNIAELAEDIKVHGLLHPIVVVEIENRKEERMTASLRGEEAKSSYRPLVPSSFNQCSYILIAGLRRLKAVESLGWTDIPATIQVPNTGNASQSNASAAISALTCFNMQLSENLQRKDLNPIELSDAILERKHRFE